MLKSEVTFTITDTIIQSIPGVKVTASGFNYRADSESKMPYTHGSSSQRFRSYEFLKTVNKLEKEVEHFACIEICCYM